MKKGDVFLLNKLLLDMRKFADELEFFFKKQDFEGVLKVKRELEILQKKVGEIL